LGIRVPIALRKYNPTFMHECDGSAGDPLLLQITPDDRIKNTYRTWKISLVEDTSIRM
jgi:hypothetical protein